MDRNTILAVALTVLVWLGYFWMFPPPKPEQAKEASGQQSQQSKPLANNRANDQTDSVSPQSPSGSKREIKQAETQQDQAGFVVPENRRLGFSDQPESLVFENNFYQITVSEAGGKLISVLYKKYNDPNGGPVELVIANPRYPASSSWPFDLSAGLSENEFLYRQLSLQKARFDLKKSEFISSGDEKAQVITARTEAMFAGIDLAISKVYTLYEKRHFMHLQIIIENLSNSPVAIQDLRLHTGYLVGPELDLSDPYNPVRFGYFAGDSYQRIDRDSSIISSDPPPLTAIHDGQIHWYSIQSRYFTLSVIPEQPAGSLWADSRIHGGTFHFAQNLGSLNLASGQKNERGFFLYIGEMEKHILRSAATDISQFGYTWRELGDSLKNTIDVHWTIEIVRDLVVQFLVWLNSLFGNYGVAIVVFAVLTKIVFFPLNQKSANSMKKMGELAPQLTDIREKYKDNPTEMNKRTMEVYKKNGVNPASGCLPILIQMPFFFALYSSLSNSVELWNAPFIWWIQDLSTPDTVAHLPEYLGGIGINILPLLMVVSQFFQQKFTTSTADPTQQKMMMFMPILFIFIFWSMPSGLVLYWTIQNILAIAQQLYTNYRSDKKA